MEIWLYNVRANLEKDIKTKQNFNLNACEYFCSYALSSREFFPCKGLRVCAITPNEPQNGWVKIFFGGGWGSATGNLWVYAKGTARDRDKNLPDILCQLARLLLKEMACLRDHCNESVGDVWL